MTPEYRIVQKRAHQRVLLAVKRGLLPPVTSYRCIDCGLPAKHYDHRDYSKPLEVDPVCIKCNFRRGRVGTPTAERIHYISEERNRIKLRWLSRSDQLAFWRKRRERAVAMHAHGLTLGEIAQQLQCTRQRVHQMLGKMKKESQRK